MPNIISPAPQGEQRPTPTPLTPERLADIRESRYRGRSLASADIDIDDLLAEVARLDRLVKSMLAAVTGHDCPDPNKGPLEIVVSTMITLSEAEKRVAELEAAAAAGLRSLSAFIFDSTDPGADALGAQWYLQQAMPQADDPFAEPNRYRDEILREAAKRQRAFIDSDDYVSDDWEAAYDVVDLIDPDEQTAAAPEASAS